MFENSRATIARQLAFFFNEIKDNQQIIDLQGDRIFSQPNGG
jgi:hypothetical protein